MSLVLEANQRRLQHTGTLDIDLLMAVDQNVVDHGVFEQRLDRTEAGHLVENLGNEILELLGIEREPFGERVLGDEAVNVTTHLVVRHFLQHRQVDLLDQPPMKPNLGVEQLVAEKRVGPRDRVRRRFRRRSGRGELERGLGNRLRRRNQIRRRDPTRSKTPEHVLSSSLFVRSPETVALPRAHRAQNSTRSFEPGEALFGPEALSALWGAMIFLSVWVMLLLGFTSSSGTPRSIASRTSR